MYQISSNSEMVPSGPGWYDMEWQIVLLMFTQDRSRKSVGILRFNESVTGEKMTYCRVPQVVSTGTIERRSLLASSFIDCHCKRLDIEEQGQTFHKTVLYRSRKMQTDRPTNKKKIKKKKKKKHKTTFKNKNKKKNENIKNWNVGARNSGDLKG